MPDQHIGFGTSFQRRLWTASWKLVLFVGLFLALYIPFVLPYFRFPETEYETLASAFGRTQIEFLAMVTVILAALAMVRYVDRQPFSMIGLTCEKALSHVVGGTLVGAALVLLVLGVLALLGMVGTGTGNGPFERDLVWSTLALMFNVVTQEVMVHGYVQQMVRGKFGSTTGVLVSSCLFVLIHYAFFNLQSILLLTNLFVAGALLGIVFLKARSLWLPIGIHFGWNFIQGPILGLPITTIDLWNSDLVELNGPDFWTGGMMGIEGGIIASAVLIGASSWYYRAWRVRIAEKPELEYSIP